MRARLHLHAVLLREKRFIIGCLYGRRRIGLQVRHLDLDCLSLSCALNFSHGALQLRRRRGCPIVQQWIVGFDLLGSGSASMTE